MKNVKLLIQAGEQMRRLEMSIVSCKHSQMISIEILIGFRPMKQTLTRLLEQKASDQELGHLVPKKIVKNVN